MAAQTMFDLIPKPALAPLKLLGRFDWLTWNDCGDQSSKLVTLALPSPHVFPQHRHFINELVSGNYEPNFLLQLYAISKLLANGPKMLRPTQDQCEALELVDPQLLLHEYTQPFPAILVELPEGFRRKMANRFGRQCPLAVLVFHESRQLYIVASCIFSPGFGDVSALRFTSSSPQTIEDGLRTISESDDADAQLHTSLLRVAINFCLLLTGYGVKHAGPLDPMRHQKLQRNARKSNQRKADRAKELLDATIDLITLDQEVVFHRHQTQSDLNPDADGRKKIPHWRRGHFRMQAWGAGHANHRLTFIKPTLINAGYFRGDVADTTYRISVPSPTSDHAPITC